MSFVKAERIRTKLKLALTGPSGSGKTYSALSLATGLGGKIAVIDTENGSAALYADKFEFSTMTLPPPFTVEKYFDAIKMAIEAKFDVLIIDSLTHAWAGEGGLLEQKEQLDSRGGKQNTYTNWSSITKKHEKFKGALLQAPIHIVATMRSKQDYVLTDVNGKQTPKKVGMAPIQREGIEYEFTTVFDIAMDHSAEASKDRTGLYVDRIFKITKETGHELNKWLEGGKPPDAKPAQAIINGIKAQAAQPKTLISEAQRKRLFAIVKTANWSDDEVRSLIKEVTGQESTAQIPWTLYDQVWQTIQNNPRGTNANN